MTDAPDDNAGFDQQRQTVRGSQTNFDGDAKGPVLSGEFKAPVSVVYEAPKTAQALHQLPAPPADFTGREAELAMLLRAVQSGGATISGLHGQGGIGKTALALVLANRLPAQRGCCWLPTAAVPGRS